MTCDHNGGRASESGERHGTLYFLCDVCKHERSVGISICSCRLDGWHERSKVVRDFDEPDFMRCPGFEARFVPRFDPIPPGARCAEESLSEHREITSIALKRVAENH